MNPIPPFSKRSSLETRTLSTCQSRNTQNNNIHCYHSYNSLLTYITSFLNDIKLNVLELKETVYTLIGFQNENYFPTTRCPECESCEIEFMMNGFRKMREDIVRVTAILKGYEQGEFTNRFEEPMENNLDLTNFNPKDIIEENQGKLNPFVDPLLRKSPLHPLHLNFQSIHEELETSRPISEYSEQKPLKNRENSCECSKMDEKLERALELINLIKNEANKENIHEDRYEEISKGNDFCGRESQRLQKEISEFHELTYEKE